MDNATKKSLWSLVLLFALFLGLGHLYYEQTGDYRAAHLLPASSHPSLKNLPDKELKEILDQPFYYLAHGHQTYVFSSFDDRYVLKLFMKDYLKRTWVKQLIPPISPFRSFLIHQGERRAYRVERLIEGYRLSSLYDPEQTGLVYVHLSQQDAVGSVLLIDGLGRRSTLELKDYVFALQQKALPAKGEFKRLIRLGDLEGIKRRLEQIFLLYRKQMAKGLYDDDHNLLDNTGFVGEQAIRHDVGKVMKDEQYREWVMMQQELDSLIRNRLEPWFAKQAPEYAEELHNWMVQSNLRFTGFLEF